MHRLADDGVGWRALNFSRRTRVRELLAVLDLGLENRLDDKIGLLSGGQRQAVSLLMACLSDVSVLLPDEHVAALDPKTAAYVLKLTDEMVGERRLTTIMVTHSMRQALEHGHRTVMLDSGRVVLDISGKERSAMSIEKMIGLFSKNAKSDTSSDAMLLS